MGVRNTILAELTSKSKSKRRDARQRQQIKKQHMSMNTTSMPQNTIISDNQLKNTIHTSAAFNADMPRAQSSCKTGDVPASPKSPNSQTTEDRPTDIMTFTMHEETEHHKTQYQRQKTDQAGKSPK